MKKLDLHIHTVATISDPTFSFSVQKLREYVQTMSIDGIAITNHNVFDIEQYKFIRDSLNDICVVLPGIEISIGIKKCGHLICISSPDEIEDFRSRCERVSAQISHPKSFISVDFLSEVYVDLNKYLWIPHYEKDPAVDAQIISDLSDVFLCGEVGSVKKFIYCKKDDASLAPVYFSDCRLTDETNEFPTRQTIFDVDEISVASLKKALIEKKHVALTEAESNDFFWALPDLQLSTGLNVIIGERSSGKTFTLNQLFEKNENVKYIKQFELLEINPEKAEKEFEDKIAAKRSSVAKEHFQLFSQAIDDVKDISLEDDQVKVGRYLGSLIKHAYETDRNDAYARCKLYTETEFLIEEFDVLKKLIAAVEELLDAHQYRELIDSQIPRDSLVALHETLISKYVKENTRNLKKVWVNDFIQNAKRTLQSRTAATGVDNVDFYNVQINRSKVRRFNVLATLVKQEQVIDRKSIEGFTIQVKKREFSSAAELKSVSGRRDVAFADIMDEYQQNPYEFLIKLMAMPIIPEAEYYKYFSFVEYQILNKYGFEVSGGERAEFNLLQEVNDAYQHDMLLIDEPESSFDNLFLKDRVNHIIRSISEVMPVVLVTHNSTVGASIRPDYIIFAKRTIENGTVGYERYCGLPSSRTLVSASGKSIKNIDAMLNSLEAGVHAYNERSHDYALLKN